MAENGKSLIQKLAAVQKEVDRIPKNGRNEHHKYDYVTESDVVDALRNHLATAGIMVIPFLDKATVVPTEKGMMAHIEVSYKFTDGTDMAQVRVAASGYDIPGDKAIYKAMTGALKYALRQTFLIPTGEDPERDTEDSRDSRSERSDVQRGSSPQPSNSGRSESGGEAGPRAPRKSDSGGEATVKFGKSKGKKLSELDEAGLVWWTKVCEESVQKNDPKWHEKNVAAFEACQAEWARRQPWREAWNMCLAIGENHGLDEDGVKVVLKEQLGISSADKLTDELVGKFQEALDLAE
jgi:hypothetical protein